MKKLFLSLLLLTVGALAFSQQLRIISEEPTPGYQNLFGFSGYGWGTRWAFIVLDMEDENYELLYGDSAIHRELWYRGNISGEALQIVYHFDKDRLIGGMWIIDDVDQPSFWAMNEYLQEVYDTNVELTVKNGEWIEAEMLPPDTNAWIIHTLDVEADSHVVHYYYRLGGT